MSEQHSPAEGAPDALARTLAGIVGPPHVLTDRELTASYETDWTGRFSGRARLVARPGSTAEVAAVMRACAAEGAAVVPQGGNTGLVGGGVPRDGEVVLSLLRLTELEPVDGVERDVVAGAGVTLAELQRHARATGLDYPLDMASRDSATVGGMIATNAGGVRVLRHGATRDRVAGIEAVLADGGVVSRMSGLLKDNSGYDLPGLFTGSEGTLAVITRARLRLASLRPQRVAALLALESTAAALIVLAQLRPALPSLEAAEVVYGDGVALVCEHTGVPPPFAAEHGCYLLLECAGEDDPAAPMAAALAAAPGVLDSAFARDRGRRDALWRYREAHTEAINAAGVPLKFDVTLPADRLARFEADVRRAVASASPGARTILFGHLGDGNLHVNVLHAEADDERVTEAVLRLAADMGGSISAEHGIGVAKARWLHLTRSEADIAAMRAVKAALDPQGILNPGVIFGGD